MPCNYKNHHRALYSVIVEPNRVEHGGNIFFSYPICPCFVAFYKLIPHPTHAYLCLRINNVYVHCRRNAKFV